MNKVTCPRGYADQSNSQLLALCEKAKSRPTTPATTPNSTPTATPLMNRMNTNERWKVTPTVTTPHTKNSSSVSEESSVADRVPLVSSGSFTGGNNINTVDNKVSDDSSYIRVKILELQEIEAEVREKLFALVQTDSVVMRLLY